MKTAKEIILERAGELFCMVHSTTCGKIVEGMEEYAQEVAKNLHKPPVSGQLPLFNINDKIQIKYKDGSSYPCDKGIFVRYEENNVVWKSDYGLLYSSSINDYKIEKR